MDGIGDDIREVLDELGTSATITKRNGSTFSEKVDPENYPVHSSEFIRQFFNSATMYYDSVAVSGDVVSYNGRNFIVTNIVQSMFEDLPVDKTAGLYMCNVAGVFKRYTTVLDPVESIKTKQWVNVATNPSTILGLQYENKLGTEQLFADDIQALIKERHILIVPAGYDIKIDDRWYPNPANLKEYYRVLSIESRRLDGCPICSLGEDTR